MQEKKSFLARAVSAISSFAGSFFAKRTDGLGGPRYSEAIFWSLCLVFFVVAGLESFTLHYQFFSSNADLGFHNQLMYKFAHFKAPSSTLWNVPDASGNHYLKNCFGDHVTGLMPLNSQLYWLFNSYALLVAQIIYLIIGARGLYKLIEFKCRHSGTALFGVLLFMMHYAVYAALDFDAHDNVYGMMFLPWILYHYYRKNIRGFILCLLVFLIARDDLALTGICMGLSLLIFDWKKERIYGLSCFVISLCYFIVAFYMIIPHLSSLPSGGYNAWRFAALGSNIPEVLKTVITRPLYALGLFVDNPDKREKLYYFLASGGALLIFQPRFFLFVFPTFFVTCMSDDWSLWGNMNHYNIAFAIVVPFVIVLCADKLRSSAVRTVFFLALLLVNYKLLRTHYLRGWMSPDRIRHASFYHRREALPEIKEALSMIPPDAPVSGSSKLTPHLAFRDKAYWFPDLNDAEYVVVNLDRADEEYYPFKKPEDYKAAVEQLKANAEWEKIYDKKNILLFKKKK